MTKEYLLSKTLYGVDIIQHLIRKEYPDYIMHIKGDDCGENPDPVYADGRIIKITVDKTIKADQRLPERKARYHYLDESLPDGDAIALATAYWHERGEQLTHQQVINRLASELYIYEEDYNPYNPNPRKSETEPEKKPEAPKMPPAPRFSFYRRPIKNTRPCREASPEDIFKYLVSDYARHHTETLRTIRDNKARSRYKAENLDYITPGGIFRTRKESDLVKASGYMVIDFDHIPDPDGLVVRLARDENFETVLAFKSPSGDGVKWIVALPLNITKPDGTPLTYGEYFTILSNYSRKTYGVEADPSGKDICRACFLPYDPNAFLNPLYIEDDLTYDITRFLHGTAQ